MKLILIVLTILGQFSFAQAEASTPQISNETATTLVKQLLEKTEIASVSHYCTKGTMTCRSMYTLRDKVTKAPANFFYDTFYSADRQVGSTCYFVPVEGSANHYYQISDTVFDGKVEINFVATDRAQVKGDDLHREFSNLVFLKLGTTKYRLGTMTHEPSKVFIEGTMYDSADPNFKEAAPLLEYFRIMP